MKQFYGRRRLPQLLLVAGLLLIQIGLFAHQFEHQLGSAETHCPLCMVADHLGHAPVSTSALACVAFIFLFLSITPCTPPRLRRPYVLRAARAPPRCPSL